MRPFLLITCSLLGLAKSAAAYECSTSNYDAERLKAQLWFGEKVVKNEPGGPGLALQVSENFWRSLDLDGRRGFIDTMQCAAAGPGKGLAQLRLVSMQTGVELAELKLGRVEFKK